VFIPLTAVYQNGYSIGESRIREKQVRDLPEESLISGYADTVSVDPILHVVAWTEVGEKRFGLAPDLGIQTG